MNMSSINLHKINESITPVLQGILEQSFREFIGATVQSFEEVTADYLDELNRLNLPAGIYSQLGFGNSLAEGALILCGQKSSFYRISENLISPGDLRMAVDVLGELSNVVGGLLLNTPLFHDPYDAFALAPPVKFENGGEVKYFENSEGLNLLLKLNVHETDILVGVLLREKAPFYSKLPNGNCKPLNQ